MVAVTDSALPSLLAAGSLGSSTFSALMPTPVLPFQHGAEVGEEEEGENPCPGRISPALEPTLKRSTVVNREGLNKVRPSLVAASDEWKAMATRPASWLVDDMRATEIPIYLHALFAGLIPPSLLSLMP